MFFILFRKFVAADSIYVNTSISEGFAPRSMSFIIRASIIVVFPAPGTAGTAILPPVYSRIGFWSSLGVILLLFIVICDFSGRRKLRSSPLFSFPSVSNLLERRITFSSLQSISFLSTAAVFFNVSSLCRSIVYSLCSKLCWNTQAL